MNMEILRLKAENESMKKKAEILDWLLIIVSIVIAVTCIYQNNIAPLVFYILGLVISIFTDGNTKKRKK